MQLNAQIVIQHIDYHWHLKPNKPLPKEVIALHNEENPNHIIN